MSGQRVLCVAGSISYGVGVSGMHFEQMARDYAVARPPYPGVVFDTLRSAKVIGPGIRVVELGAGSGLATGEVIRAGSEVVALEPGTELARLLRHSVPEASVVVSRLEDADLAPGAFDSVIAATAMHWLDLSVCLPKLHRALRPRGWLAVWRTIFGDETVATPFRTQVDRIVAGGGSRGLGTVGMSERPSMGELAAGGWFDPVGSERWRWSIDLSTDQVRGLFRTFSDWSEADVDAAAGAADLLGGVVTEHYQTVLHLLRRAPTAS